MKWGYRIMEKYNFKKFFKNVEEKYRPVPFWSWNEKLDAGETAEQVRVMHKAGIGGFFMHARGGLQTEYMGDKWFENVDAAINAAHDCGMGAWAYDENGWPSGFGNGAVNGMGVEYQQKYLRMTDNEPQENVICKSGEHWFYYDVNPFYVDTLDSKVIAEFIKTSYEPYYERYGNEIEGFFTDEPQISRNGIPWSFVFEDEYRERYSENILEHLEELYLPVGDYKNTRVKFWKMVTDLFSSAFMKQIYDWCSERGLKLTGHLVLEDKLEWQLITNGACMPHYEYMHIPGMDWLGRNIYSCLTPMQVSSICEQLGKERILSETFALCGHNVSFAELKGIYEWQMVHGINLLCQHLEGYSLRGIRKRDYPPAMYYQQPWWSDYDKFNEAMSRESKILSRTKKEAKVLVLHPQTTAWSLFDNEKNEGLTELDKRFIQIVDTLERKHILYHFGDETIMERHATVKDGKIIIGEQSYDRVICEHCDILLDNTEKLLKEFVKTGGRLITADELNANDIVDNENITYTKRCCEDFTVHYFVNTSANYEKAAFNVNGEILDIYSGDLREFGGRYEFEPWDSLMIIENGVKNTSAVISEASYIRPEGKFKLLSQTENVLLLDMCDYYFDGELQEKNGYVLNICERANALERAVKIHQDYHVMINYMPEELFLVCETPEKFKIQINGVDIDKKYAGYFADKSLKKLDISEYVKLGENTVSFECDFVQSEEFYESRRKSFIFESEKNKLAYDMEIEAVYLVGDFSVKTVGEWTKLDKKAVRYCGDFEIDEPSANISLENIEQQGFPFFCGEMKLEGEIDIVGDNPVLSIDRRGINVVRVEINGTEKTMMTSDRLSLKDFGVKGKTKIKLTLVNNLRNLLGPHHLKEGECHVVCPSSFFKESCLWNENAEQQWDNDYCFVETGV